MPVQWWFWKNHVNFCYVLLSVSESYLSNDIPCVKKRTVCFFPPVLINVSRAGWGIRYLRGQVLSDKTVKHPAATNPAPANLGQPSGTKNQIETPPTTAIIDRLNALTLSETQRLTSQFLSIGPNNSLSRSQRCIRGDDLAKQAAASNTKGVVGKSGNATPTAPSARNNNPRTVQRYKPCHPRP